MKKHLRLLLCAVLVLCMLQLSALAAQPNPLEIVCSDVGQTTREITVSVFATEEITDGVFDFTYDASKLTLLEVSSPDSDAAVINGPAGVTGTAMGANLDEGNIRIGFVFDAGSCKEDVVLQCRFALSASFGRLVFALKNAVLHNGISAVACDDSSKTVSIAATGGSGNAQAPGSAVDTPDQFFLDVPENAYYYNAVQWAAEKGITGGTDATHFSPNATCTRAQAVTFLWRAAGSPAPKSSTMPFTDVPAGSYYEAAVLWAVENGITKGTSDTTFSPNANCSRGQIVTFLWRSLRSPAAGSANPFNDVTADAYYADAVLWAVKAGITNGTSSVTFSPNANCTRAQIVTFIWRALAE